MIKVFDYIKKLFEKYPYLEEIFLKDPTTINDPSRNIEEIKNMINVINYPLIICENQDSKFPEIPKQINFIFPPALKESKELYAINIKNDINMYKQLYKVFSTKANKVIKDTKECLKNLYQPFKSLYCDINKYLINFYKSIDQITIPLKNGKTGLDDINYEHYTKDRQSQFFKDKNEIFKEIDIFYKEANEFYFKYKILNEVTSKDISNLVERFKKLIKPAEELSNFMKNFIKAFEHSAKCFNNLNDKKKIDEALRKIKEPILEFQKKNNIENMFILIKNDIKIEKINQMIEISNEIKDKINKLVLYSEKISNKIIKIREKYGEPQQIFEKIDIAPISIATTQKISIEFEKQQKKIEKTVSSIITKMSKNIEKVKEQTRLDLLFIMDITSGMYYFLDQVRIYILKMIEVTQIECAGSEINIGFIGYKDFNDLDFGEEYINLEFTTDYKSIRKNIENICVQGGGDIPEDLCEAFELGKYKNWSGNTRIAILVTDAPCHGNKYHDLSTEDNFPDGDREGRNIEDYIEYFAENKISLYCLDILNDTHKMFDIFKKVYDKSKKENSKNEFALESGQTLINMVNKNAINMYQKRDKLDISQLMF